MLGCQGLLRSDRCEEGQLAEEEAEERQPDLIGEAAEVTSSAGE